MGYTLHALRRMTEVHLHVHTAYAEDGYTCTLFTRPARQCTSTLMGGVDGYNLHVHTASGGKGYTLHGHTVFFTAKMDTPCMSTLMIV
jgi:hypothetical protein